MTNTKPTIRFESAAEALFVKLALLGIPDNWRSWLDRCAGFKWCKLELWATCREFPDRGSEKQVRTSHGQQRFFVVRAFKGGGPTGGSTEPELRSGERLKPIVVLSNSLFRLFLPETRITNLHTRTHGRSTEPECRGAA